MSHLVNVPPPISLRSTILVLVLAAASLALATPHVAAAQTMAVPACSPEAAEAAVVPVAGVVVDESNARLPGATVTLACGTTVVRGFSRADGTFSVGLAPGPYLLRVSLAGFDVHTAPILASASGAPVHVQLWLAGLVDNVVVVSAAGAERTLIDAPASVSVIDDRDLQAIPVRDLTDILGRVEGVTLSRGSNLQAIQMRGLGPAYTLILVDGRRVSSNAALFRGNDFESAWVPAEDIERVEVVRGPMSSLYGSDAIGGVVNIITKRIGTDWTGGVTADYAAQQHREAGDSYQGGFNVSGPVVANVLGLKLHANFNHRDADGVVNPPGDAGQAPLPGFDRQRNVTVGSSLAWTPDAASDVSFAWDYSDREHGAFTLQRHALAGGYERRWSSVVAAFKVYGDVIDNLTGNVATATNPNRAANVTGDARLTLAAGRHTVTAGAESRYQQLDDPTTLAGLPGSDDYGRNTTASVMQHAVFGEDEIRLRDDLFLTLGGRLDRHEHFGVHATPRTYLVYRATEWVTLKGGWSRAFRAPTLLQGSENWGSVSCGSATAGCFIVGSEQLDPETSSSVEGGLQVGHERWRVGATVFHNDLEDMIDITSRTANRDLASAFDNFVGFLADGRPIFRYQNIARVRTVGVEAMARLQITGDTQLQANYTHLDSENRSGATPVPLAFQPAHSINATFDWRPAGALGAYVRVQYVGRQYTFVPANGTGAAEYPGYATFDIGGSYRLTSRITARAGILNVADRAVDRQVSTDFNEDGRRFFLSIHTSF